MILNYTPIEKKKQIKKEGEVSPSFAPTLRVIALYPLCGDTPQHPEPRHCEERSDVAIQILLGT
jgi:hypothetical protein